jgi:hypothetical protein
MTPSPSPFSIFFRLLAFLTLVSIASAESISLDSGVATVKIDRTRGGAITWVSVSGGTNLINLHDLGRLVQQSYYAGARLDRRAEGQSPAWSPWTWNPVQGGSFAHAPGILDKFESRDGVLHSLTRPKLWDMPDETAACTMEQQTEFEPGQRNIIRVTNTLVIRRPADDRWGDAKPNHQELPAIYLVRAFSTARIYEGEGRWTDFPMPALSAKGWGRPVAPRRAMAFFRADDLGFAIYSPAADATWNSGVTGTSRSADPKHADTTHVAPIATVTLDRNATYTFRYWMLLGDATTLASDLDKLIPTYP